MGVDEMGVDEMGRHHSFASTKTYFQNKLITRSKSQMMQKCIMIG